MSFEVLRQPLEEVSHTYNFASVLGLNSFAELALRMMAMRDSGSAW